MTSTLLRKPLLDHDRQTISDDLLAEIRVAELVMALSGCSARRAIALVRESPADTPFDRLVHALAASRHEIGRSDDRSTVRMLP